VSNIKQITLQGAGIDTTTINCGSLTTCVDMTVPAGAAKPLWRITGFTFTGGAGFGGLIMVNGLGRDWRIDTNKFYNWGISENPHPVWVSHGAPGL